MFGSNRKLLDAMFHQQIKQQYQIDKNHEQAARYYRALSEAVKDIAARYLPPDLYREFLTKLDNATSTQPTPTQGGDDE